MATPTHIPVLMDEVVESLSPQAGETVVDCTAGLGGHAAALGEKLGAAGTIVLFDLDPGNLARASERVRGLAAAPRVVVHHASFAEIGMKLRAERGGDAGTAADIVLADLGFASNQMDDGARGLSFMRDGPLDMRLNPQAPISAAELVATMTERDLTETIRDLGEEPQGVARAIAQKIVQVRQTNPISTTAELATLIRSVVPRRPGASIDPATKTFQALRIAVNDELGHLDRLLASLERAARHTGAPASSSTSGVSSWLRSGSRIGIISFHSLEDRRVKQAFGRMVDSDLAEHITRKPLTASERELSANPRSRSAKLRVIKLR